MDPITRINFFDGLFLTQEEFQTEQNYHIQLRRLNNAWFRSPGILQGLEVTHLKEGTFSISPGVALALHQNQGVDEIRELVLGQNLEYSLTNAEMKDLESFYLFVQYKEEQSYQDENKGAEKFIHTQEKAEISHSVERPKPDKQRLILAKVLLKSTDGALKVVDRLVWQDDKGQPLRRQGAIDTSLLNASEIRLKGPQEEAAAPSLKRLAGAEAGLELKTDIAKITGLLQAQQGAKLGQGLNPGEKGLEVQGNLSFGTEQNPSALTHIGSHQLKGSLSVEGVANVGRELAVQGDANFAANLKAKQLEAGQATIAENLRVAGQTQLASLTSGPAELQSLRLLQGQETLGDVKMGSLSQPSQVLLRGHLRLETPNEEPSLVVAGDVSLVNKGSKLEVEGDCVIKGKLTVNEQTVIKSKEMSIADPIITLGEQDAGTPPMQINKGLEVHRGGTPTKLNPMARLLWSEKDQKWLFGLGDQLETMAPESKLNGEVTRINQEFKKVEDALDVHDGEIRYLKERGSDSGGSYPPMLKTLADGLALDDLTQRRSNLRDLPVTDEGSVLSYTLGAGLDFGRSLYSMALELLDLDEVLAGRLGDKKSLYLDSLFEGREMAEFLKHLSLVQGRFEAFRNQNRVNLIAAGLEVLVQTMESYAQRYKIDFKPMLVIEDIAQQIRSSQANDTLELFHGPNLRKLILENLFKPLFLPEPSPGRQLLGRFFGTKPLNHVVAKRFKEFGVIFARKAWQKFTEDFFFTNQYQFTTQGTGNLWIKDGTLLKLMMAVNAFRYGAGLRVQLPALIARNPKGNFRLHSIKGIPYLWWHSESLIYRYPVSLLQELWSNEKLLTQGKAEPDLCLQIPNNSMLDLCFHGGNLFFTQKSPQALTLQVVDLLALQEAYLAQRKEKPMGTITLNPLPLSTPSRGFMQSLAACHGNGPGQVACLLRNSGLALVFQFAGDKGVLPMMNWKENRINLKLTNYMQNPNGFLDQLIYRIALPEAPEKFFLLHYQTNLETHGLLIGNTGGANWANGTEASYQFQGELCKGVSFVATELGQVFLNDQETHQWTAFPAAALINPTQFPNLANLAQGTRSNGTPLFLGAPAAQVKACLNWYPGNILDCYAADGNSLALKVDTTPWISFYEIQDHKLVCVRRVSCQTRGNRTGQIAHYFLDDTRSKLLSFAVVDNFLELHLTE